MIYGREEPDRSVSALDRWQFLDLAEAAILERGPNSLGERAALVPDAEVGPARERVQEGEPLAAKRRVRKEQGVELPQRADLLHGRLVEPAVVQFELPQTGQLVEGS